MPIADRLQVTPKTGVADQRLVAFRKLALQRGENRRLGRRHPCPLPDDCGRRCSAARPTARPLPHSPLVCRACSAPAARTGRHHYARACHCARHAKGDVSRVARPHLRADRPPVTADDYREDHLPPIGPVVLAVAERRSVWLWPQAPSKYRLVLAVSMNTRSSGVNRSLMGEQPLDRLMADHRLSHGRPFPEVPAGSGAWLIWGHCPGTNKNSRGLPKARQSRNRGSLVGLAKANEVRCAGDIVRLGARLEWLHPEVQHSSRVTRSEYGFDTMHGQLH